MKKRLLSIAICFLMVAGLLAGTALPVLAEENNDGGNVTLNDNDSFNLDDFMYTRDVLTKKITLKKYNGNAENIVIPATITIADIKYNVQLDKYGIDMFKDCKSLKTIDFSAIGTDNLTDTSYMFSNCENLTDVIGLDTKNVTNMAYMFVECKNLTSAGVSGLNTRNVTNMSAMFSGCSSLEKIPDYDTKNVTSMYHMFYECRSLTDISNNTLDTRNVKDMNAMFQNCYKLKSANLKNWNTSNVTNMGYMFCDCINLEEADLSGFNTSNVTATNYMFEGCYKLANPKVSTWDVSNVIGMFRMFASSGVEYLDLSNWDFSSAEYVEDFIAGCKHLEKIETPINLKQNIEFGWYYHTIIFAREDDPSVTYEALPKEEKKSFTIVRVHNRESGNVISVDYEAGTAVVVDEVESGERTVPISTIEEGYVYRMYNPFSGEHFYTKDAHERDYLVGIGWHHEAESDYIATDARDDDAVTIYRLFNPAEGGMHFYTADAIEVRSMIKAGWTYEGIAYYGIEKHSEVGYPLYRVYNPYSPGGQHVWTTDVNEYSTLIANDWIDEDVCWNILTDDGARSKEIIGSFRYIHPDIPELVCTYTFNGDGTGIYDISGEVQKLTYAIYGNELSIMFEGQDIPMNVEFTVDAEALTIVDGTGAYMVYYRI